MIRISSFLLLFTTLFCVQDLQAQLSERQIRQIDTLFVSWNAPNHPGGAVGVMKGHQFIYSKAFGLASLEYLAPNTPGTRFNIASVCIASIMESFACAFCSNLFSRNAAS